MADKLERRARRSPGSLTFEQVRALAETHGFVWRTSTKGHAVLAHPRLPYPLGVARPHPDKHVKPTYVLSLVDAIDLLRAEAAEGDEV